MRDGIGGIPETSSLYNNMNQTSVHNFRGEVMHPEPATKDTGVA